MHLLHKIPTVKLAEIPTPLQKAPRLAEKIGIKDFYIKRDDLTGLAGGGNKARKLEYDFAEVIKGGYDVVLTTGGLQSNHARMTAAACRKLGIDVKLVLGGPDFKIPQGNLLLDILFNAEIRYLVDDDANDSLAAEMKKWSDELYNQGRKPYTLPIGGSTGLSALGYVKFMEELSGQFGNNPVQLIAGAGSCGTLAGIFLGSKIFLPEARIIGISVSRTVSAIKKTTIELIKESASIIQYNIPYEDMSIECYDDYFCEYGVMTKEGEQAISDCANLEGIILDPVYTGKVMAGLYDLTYKNIIDKNIPVIFLHTGGFPIVFSFNNNLSYKMNITKIKK